MADLVKMFVKNDPGGIYPDEQVLAVALVQPRASIIGAPGNAAFGGVIENVAGEMVRDAAANRALAAEGEIVGDAATFPAVEHAAIVITSRRLVLYDAVKGARKLRGPVGEYPLDRIAGISFEKKSIYDVIRLAFADGSVRAFDSGKGQRLESLVEALARAKGG